MSNLDSLGYLPNEAIRQAAYVYDAVWTAAFALHDTSIELQQGAVSGANKLEDFNHFANETLANKINEVILRAAKNTMFRGVSVSNFVCMHTCVCYIVTMELSYFYITIVCGDVLLACMCQSGCRLNIQTFKVIDWGLLSVFPHQFVFSISLLVG